MSYQVAKRHEGNLLNETNKQKKTSLKGCRDIPGGPVVKILPCNAQDTGSIPVRGTKIPQVSEQLSPHATTRESATRDPT